MSTESPSHLPHEVHVMPRGVVWVIRLTLATLIVIGSVRGYQRLIETAPTRQMRPVKEREAIVEVVPLAKGPRRVTVVATGTVMPARELALNARVSGRVVAVHPALEPGGRLAAGDVAVSLDRTDYELAVSRGETQLVKARVAVEEAEIALSQTKSAVVQAESQQITAEYNYKIELGYQEVAKHEWEMLDNKANVTELEKELTLRKPHLRKAEGDVQSAEAGVAVAKEKVKSAEASLATAQAALHDAEVALSQARLDLERTSVKVPFAAVVLERTVSMGSQVTTQTELASLVDAAAFWVEVSVPMDRLPWITVRQGDQPGATAVLRPTGVLATSAEWPGEVIRLLPSLEENGRQARLLVEVRNPLETGRLPLLLGAFVQAEIAGPELPDVFAIPRAAVHNGNEVWIRNGEGRLAVCPVPIEWSDSEVVVTRSGVAEGDMLVISDIASPVPGMQLALLGEGQGKADEKPAAAAPAPKME